MERMGNSGVAGDAGGHPQFFSPGVPRILPDQRI